MAKATQQQLEELLAKAARDSAFKQKLIDSPQEAAKQLGIQLDTEDCERLALAHSDLERFGGNADLHPDDAKSWAVGLFHVRTWTTKP